MATKKPYGMGAHAQTPPAMPAAAVAQHLVGNSDVVGQGAAAPALAVVPASVPPVSTPPANAPTAEAPLSEKEQMEIRVERARAELSVIRSDKKKERNRQEHRITLPLALDLYNAINEVSHRDRTYMSDDIETILRKFFFPEEFADKA